MLRKVPQNTNKSFMLYEGASRNGKFLVGLGDDALEISKKVKDLPPDAPLHSKRKAIGPILEKAGPVHTAEKNFNAIQNHQFYPKSLRFKYQKT